MANGSTAHEVLAVVFQVRQLSTRNPQLSVLLWQRAKEPQRGAWALPGGMLRHDEDMSSSVRRQLAEKVDLREVVELELELAQRTSLPHQSKSRMTHRRALY